MSVRPEQSNGVGETVLTVPVVDAEWSKLAVRVAGALLNMGFKPGEAFSITRPTSFKLATLAEHTAKDRREQQLADSADVTIEDVRRLGGLR